MDWGNIYDNTERARVVNVTTYGVNQLETIQFNTTDGVQWKYGRGGLGLEIYLVYKMVGPIKLFHPIRGFLNVVVRENTTHILKHKRR